MLAAWCVHWFNPVVSLGFRRLRADRELAADEWALKHLETARVLAYGRTLFKTVANRPGRFPFQPAMIGISEDGAQMKQRLQRIASFLPTRRVFGSLAGLGALLLLAGVVLGQSAATPVAPSKAEAKPVEKPTPSPTPVSPAPLASPGKDAALAPKPPPDGYALRKAAGEGRIETARGLLDHGANINFQDEHGFTSLSWAAYCGKEDVCLLLLERGADGRIEDQDGRNAA